MEQRTYAPDTVITLGTAGGPMPNPMRAQPAHVMMVGDTPVLIDCGEGAMGQLKRAGIEFRNVHHLFLTHHHFDHIGSLFACLGLNMMVQRKQPLTIYGPAGTKAIIDRLCDACDVPAEIGYGVPGQSLPHPRDFTEFVELAPGDTVQIGGATVRCCENTHYRGEAEFGTPGHISLSLRIDTGTRSVVFTGDTGPCTALETLAAGADLMVSEMMDIQMTMGRVRAMNPNMPEAQMAKIESHMRGHHIGPEEVAGIAQRAGVKEVVSVHFPPGIAVPDTAQGYVDRVKAGFKGSFHIGQDLAAY